MSEAEPTSQAAYAAESERITLRHRGAITLACAAAALGLAPSVTFADSSPQTVLEAAPQATIATTFGEDTGSVIANTNRVGNVGEGVWSTNIGDGFFLGRVENGDKVDLALYSESGKYLFLFITDRTTGIQRCSWVDARAVKLDPSDTPNLDNPCRPWFGPLKNLAMIRGRNCRTGECTDGVEAELTPGCDPRAYGNVAPAEKGPLNMNYPENGSGPYDYAGQVQSPVYYRLKLQPPDARNRRYAVIRSDVLGWVFIRKSCIEGIPQGN